MKITEQTLKDGLELQNKLYNLKSEIQPAISDYSLAYFDYIDDFYFDKDGGINVSATIRGRWGGSDDSVYFEIPKEYFLADDKAEWIKLKKKQIEDAQKKEILQQAAIDKAKKDAAELAMYKRLKEKFNDSQKPA